MGGGLYDAISNYFSSDNSGNERTQPAAVNRTNKGDSLIKDQSRPSMQQDAHPEHNMPYPEHDGVQIKANPGGQDD